MERQESEITVGILSSSKVCFTLSGSYHVLPGSGLKALEMLKEDLTSGYQEAEITPKGILWKDQVYQSLEFIPLEPGQSFLLEQVEIGKQFHWNRKESQMFRGALRLIQEEDQITAINRLPLETYLECVIASEMSATAHKELLKAHAVISRSWLLAQIQATSRQSLEDCTQQIPEGWIKWYNHSSHTHFDVCADDHCQRYQGLTRLRSEKALEAVQETRGEILMDEGEICDARYSKCCGGATERFSSCWQQQDMRYLEATLDRPEATMAEDLSQEEAATAWILSHPESFCNTQDKLILSQVLNGYDQETAHFFRWQEQISDQEIQAIILEKSGVDLGPVTDLLPLERGSSGRITRLRIKGTKRDLVIGKELEIRKMLSRTHLLSSAFVVEKIKEQASCTFILKGAGWGHGVGLCQIGAAMMAQQGYNYKQILSHYYHHAQIRKIYK